MTHLCRELLYRSTRAEIAGRIGDFLPEVGNDPKTRVPVFDPARALASYGLRDVKAILASSISPARAPTGTSGAVALRLADGPVLARRSS